MTDNHNMKYMKVCPICGNTFETNVEHRQACKVCLEKSNPKTVSNMLKVLEILGWSDLIDSRWRDDVIKEIKTYIPNISDTDLNEILNLVLV